MDRTWLAPGKLIIIGEYAVLYGSESLVTSVDRYCKVTVKSSITEESIFRAKNIPGSEFRFRLDDQSELEFLTPVLSDLTFAQHAVQHVYQFLKDNGLKFHPCVITADTSDFYHRLTGSKLGLGSSAAFSVAILKALLEFNNYTVSPDNLFKMSHDVHFTAQGKKGSGIDIAASVFGSILKYKMVIAPDGVVKVNKNSDLYMIYIWSGEAASTSDMLETLNIFQQSNPQIFSELINKLKDLANQGCQSYSTDTKAFLDIVKEYYLQMKIMGEKAGIPIISKNHCDIAEEVMNLGAVYKPSGAGGGDLGIAFCSSETIYQDLHKKLVSKNIDVMDISAEEMGVHFIDH